MDDDQAFENPYTPPADPDVGPARDEAPVNTVPSPLHRFGNYVLVLVNGFLGYQLGLGEVEDSAKLTGYVMGSAFFFPFVAVGISQVLSRHPNPRTRRKVFFYASLFMVLLNLQRLTRPGL